MLWVQAKARPSPRRTTSRRTTEENPKPQPPKPEPAPQPGHGDGSASPTNGQGRPDARPRAEPGQEPIKTDGQPAPGAGNLPVIPDRDELAPMSREDAEAHLRQAIDKVMQEGRAAPAALAEGAVGQGARLVREGCGMRQIADSVEYRDEVE